MVLRLIILANILTKMLWNLKSCYSLQHLELRDLTHVAYLDLLQETWAAVGAQLPDEHVAIAYFPNLAYRAAGMVVCS